MAYDVTNLPNYVEEHKAELAALMVATPKEFDIFAGLSGVVGATALPNLNAEIVFQNGSSCGFNAQGDDVISERIMQPAVLKVNKTFCPNDLIGKYAEYLVKVGAGKEELPFEEILINANVNKIASEVSKAFWMGDKQNGTGNLAFNDGILTQVKAEKTAVSAGSTIKESIENLLSSLGEYIANDALFMSKTNFTRLTLELQNANLYHYDPKVDGFAFYFPGTSVMVYGVDGLEGSNAVIALNPNNTFYGYNEKDDATSLDVWYSKDDRIFKMAAQFVVGAKYRFPEEVGFVELGESPAPSDRYVAISTESIRLEDGQYYFMSAMPNDDREEAVKYGERVEITAYETIHTATGDLVFSRWYNTRQGDTEENLTLVINSAFIDQKWAAIYVPEIPPQ